MAYNYTTAFVAYSKGSTPEEISREFQIPLDSLKSKMRQEGWVGLADKVCGHYGPIPRNAAEALDRIEANRAESYAQAAKLRDHFNTIIEQLAAGTLKIKKSVLQKGQIFEFEVEPSISDLVSLATAVRMAHDMCYRALGDQGAIAVQKAAVAAATQGPPAPITVIIPGIVATPRTPPNSSLTEPEPSEQENGGSPNQLN